MGRIPFWERLRTTLHIAWKIWDFLIPVLVWSQAETRCGGPTIASSEAQVVTLELPTGLPLHPLAVA